MLLWVPFSGIIGAFQGEAGVVVDFNSVPLKAGIRRLNKSNSSPVSPVFPPVPCNAKRRTSKPG
jgi:hypothetical protein